MLLLIFLVVYVGGTVWVANIAKKRGHKPGGYIALSLIVSPLLALLIVSTSARRYTREQKIQMLADDIERKKRIAELEKTLSETHPDQMREINMLAPAATWIVRTPEQQRERDRRNGNIMFLAIVGTVITLVILVTLAASHAAAAHGPRLPGYVLGEWCLDDTTKSYVRGPRRNCSANWLIIRANGFALPEANCRLLSAALHRGSVYRATVRCSFGDADEPWTESYWIGRADDVKSGEPQRLLFDSAD